MLRNIGNSHCIYFVIAALSFHVCAADVDVAEFLALSAKDIDGNVFKFYELEKNPGSQVVSVAVIVNVASEWGETDKGYKEFKQLLNAMQTQGLKIVAFPCNQFGAQEPGSPSQIKDFVGRYGLSSKESGFYLMDKVDVNGENTHPVYSFLKQHSGNDADISWNFATKFLVSCDGSACSVSRHDGVTTSKAVMSRFKKKKQEI